MFLWKRCRPSAGDAFTQTRTILTVPPLLFPFFVCSFFLRFFFAGHFGWSNRFVPKKLRSGLKRSGPKAVAALWHRKWRVRTRRQLGAYLRHLIIETSEFPLITTAKINQLMNESTEAGGLRRRGRVRWTTSNHT